MALTGLIPGSEVFFSEHEGIDWNVIFLLLGMMIIVGVIRQTGLFEFLGIWAAKRSRGRPYRLMLMLITAGSSTTSPSSCSSCRSRSWSATGSTSLPSHT